MPTHKGSAVYLLDFTRSSHGAYFGVKSNLTIRGFARGLYVLNAVIPKHNGSAFGGEVIYSEREKIFQSPSIPHIG